MNWRRELQFVSNNPDLLVNFFSGTQSGIPMTDVPIFVMPDPNYGAWTGYRATFAPGEHITEGTLGIHLVDQRSNRLVWQGIARDRVTEAMTANPDETVNWRVEKIFSEIPHQRHECLPPQRPVVPGSVALWGG